jgi:hypothetical protein
MSFYRILSTLCSHVVFHNIPHFSRGGKRAGQKVHRTIAVAVQNVKPLYFLSRSFEIREIYCQKSDLSCTLLPALSHKNLLSYSICFNNQIDQGMRRRVSRGRD